MNMCLTSFSMSRKSGGDFYILSAGTDYYIHYILKKYGITDVEVYSNKGFFKEDNVHMDIDENHWHYSERYGIDKSKVIQKLKEEYETVYFAGDSEPDSHPAKFADVTFAKDALQDLLRQQGVPFVAVETFEDINNILKKKGGSSNAAPGYQSIAIPAVLDISEGVLGRLDEILRKHQFDKAIMFF